MNRRKGRAWTGSPIRLLPFLFLFLGASAAYSSPEASPPSYADTLVERARVERLADDPYWRTLGHYKRGIFGLRSLVDDPAFFLSPDGKRDPEAELEATIRSFFLPPAEDEEHPVCRFVARFAWLKERLEFDESRLPVPRCAAFEDLVEEIRPTSATLIFPTSYMNSPASMFGHTLITIRTAYDTDLLSYAINYSAVTDETFGPFYIAKGLLGLYEGYFSILPYYAKLQEYSDVNDRDIWEYALDLDETEVRRLLMHIYELEEIYADYYFFSENCSYDLLFLLDAARPGLDLTDRTRWWVIPLDTIREVREAGLVKNVLYRPSKSTKVRKIASLLGEEAREDALDIVGGEIDPSAYAAGGANRREKIGVLDLAAEYLQYRYTKKQLGQDPYVGRFMAVLGARSDLGGADERRYVIPAPPRPEEGHGSNRVSLGYGSDDERPFAELRLRPAYHGLLDNERGYKEGSQIVFLEAAIRYYPHDGAAELDRLDLIDIVSLAPRDRLFKPTSWKIRTDLHRRTMETGERELIYRLNPGFGVAYDSPCFGLVYGMLETDFHVGGALEESYSAGGGASAGFLAKPMERWKTRLHVRAVIHALGDRDELFRADWEHNVRLGSDVALAGGIGPRREREEWWWEGAVRLHLFF